MGQGLCCLLLLLCFLSIGQLQLLLGELFRVVFLDRILVPLHLDHPRLTVPKQHLLHDLRVCMDEFT